VYARASVADFVRLSFSAISDKVALETASSRNRSSSLALHCLPLFSAFAVIFFAFSPSSTACYGFQAKDSGIDFGGRGRELDALDRTVGRRRGLLGSTAPAVPVAAAGLEVIGHRTTFEIIRRSQPFRLPPSLFLSLFGGRLAKQKDRPNAVSEFAMWV
jgi:hypothetical protein